MAKKDSFSTMMGLEWDAFLDWFKEATEAGWQALEPVTVESVRKRRVLGSFWQPETKWSRGLSGDEITAVQQKYDLTFPSDYRQFLAQLGSPNRPMLGTGWEGQTLILVERPSFTNWLTDDEAITAALRWPLEGLLFDVEHNDLWLDSWGKKPDDESETAEHLARLVAQAPPLIPIYGHRYLLDYPINGRCPVLSVYQADIIIYGTNLQSYLLRECANLLNLYVEESVAKQVETLYQTHAAAIPFWGDLLTLNEK